MIETSAFRTLATMCTVQSGRSTTELNPLFQVRYMRVYQYRSYKFCDLWAEGCPRFRQAFSESGRGATVTWYFLASAVRRDPRDRAHWTSHCITPSFAYSTPIHTSSSCAPLVQPSRHCGRRPYRDHQNTSAEPAAPKQPANSTLPSVATRNSPSSSAYNNSSSAPRKRNKRRSHERRREYSRLKI